MICLVAAVGLVVAAKVGTPCIVAPSWQLHDGTWRVMGGGWAASSAWHALSTTHCWEDRMSQLAKQGALPTAAAPPRSLRAPMASRASVSLVAVTLLMFVSGRVEAASPASR